ncbi:MAG TPA: hypothetical protein VFF03_03350 [Rhodocyclaceae bacterium]|nr:hypothetical protein [Rhodocyclaceae bacterium]
MKTTALFALIVALLARQPAPRGSGPEDPGAARPPVQPPATAAAPKPVKPDDAAAKNGLSKPLVKGAS